MEKVEGRNGGTINRAQKGDPAFPGAGRPKGSIGHTTKFKRFLEGQDEYEIEKDGKKVKVKLTREEILMYRLYKIAMEGDPGKYGDTSGVSVSAIKEIHERAHGKPTQPTEHSGPDGEPIKLQVSGNDLTIDEKRLLVKLAKKANKGE